MANGLLVRLHSGLIDVDELRGFVESLPLARPAPCAIDGHAFAYELRAGASPADARVPRFEFGSHGAAVSVDWSDNAYGHAARAIDWVLSRHACEGRDFDHGSRYEDNERCRGWLRDWQLDELGHTPEHARRVILAELRDAALTRATYGLFEWRLSFRPTSDVEREPELTLQFGVDAVELEACGAPRFTDGSTGLERSERVAALVSRLTNEVLGVREARCSEGGDLRLEFVDEGAPALALRSPADAVDGSDTWSLTRAGGDSAETILVEGHARSGVRVPRLRVRGG